MLSWEGILVGVGATLFLYGVLVFALVTGGRRETARAVAAFVPDCVVFFRRLLAEPRISRRRKLVLAVALLYLAMPFDLVPDFIPVAGYLDDAVVVALVLRYLLRSAGHDVVEEHWPGPAASLRVVLALAGPRWSVQDRSA